MRVTPRVHREEAGVAAVLVALLLVVLVGMMALAIDGGLMWVKFRQIRTANDAAALAAALSCATREGQAGADASADQYAVTNASDATRVADPVYTPNCDAPSGEVVVRYGGEQSLMFAPAIGITSGRTPVTASATAIWGSAGGALNVVPMMLSADRLNNCGVPTVPDEWPVPCHFWWHQDLLASSTWALLNLDTWGISSSAGGCNPSGTDLNEAIANGWPSALMLDANPTYVCVISGVRELWVKINDLVPQKFMFPVNDPDLQVDAAGNLCPPESDGTCDVDKYAIIGFAELEVVAVLRGAEAAELCGPLPPEANGNGNYFCMDAQWVGWNTDGYVPGGGASFGVQAVGLSE